MGSARRRSLFVPAAKATDVISVTSANFGQLIFLRHILRCHLDGSMGKSRNKGLSQAEIWDDSALLQSWDDALTEYKVSQGSPSASSLANSIQLYHSIHARGERVEDVIKSFEADEKTILANGTALPREAVNIGTNDAMPEDLEDGELEEPFENTEAKHNAKSEGNMQVSDRGTKNESKSSYRYRYPQPMKLTIHVPIREQKLSSSNTMFMVCPQQLLTEVSV